MNVFSSYEQWNEYRGFWHDWQIGKAVSCLILLQGDLDFFLHVHSVRDSCTRRENAAEILNVLPTKFWAIVLQTTSISSAATNGGLTCHYSLATANALLATTTITQWCH